MPVLDGITFTVDGVEWPVRLNDVKKENYMSEIEVRVGDVWSINDGEDITITKVDDTRISSWYYGTNGVLYSYSNRIKVVTDDYKLIERDGKKISEFEEGAWYPVNHEEIHQYRAGLLHNSRGGGGYLPDTYSWIGEKINLKELK